MVRGEVLAYSFGQEPGSLEAAILALSDEVGGEYGSIAIQETDDAFLVCLGTGVRSGREEKRREGETFNALSSARRAVAWSVLRLTSSWELV